MAQGKRINRNHRLHAAHSSSTGTKNRIQPTQAQFPISKAQRNQNTQQFPKGNVIYQFTSKTNQHSLFESYEHRQISQSKIIQGI